MRRCSYTASQAGLSILSMLIAIAMGATVILYAGDFIKISWAQMRFMQDEQELLALKVQLEMQINCEATKANGAQNCVINKPLSIRSHNSELISDNGSTKIGNFLLRSSCASCPHCPGGRKLLIEAKRDGNHPISDVPYGWTDPFAGIPPACDLSS